jgi:PBSX family phage terminase large subunit
MIAIEWLIIMLESFKDSGYNFILASNTHDQLFRNIIRPLFQILNSKGLTELRDIKYYKKSRIRYESLDVHLLSATNEGSLKGIVGLTSMFAFVDEVNTFPPDALDRIYDRHSLPNAHLLFLFNPTVRTAPIFQNWIDNPGLSGILNDLVFQIWDNTFLPQSYIDSMLAKYAPGSVGHSRYILGEPVSDENQIYSMFRNTDIVDTYYPKPLGQSQYFVSSDYGGTSMAIFQLWAYDTVDKLLYLIDEYSTHFMGDDELLTDEQMVKNGVDNLLSRNKIKSLNIFYVSHDASNLYKIIKNHKFKSCGVVTVRKYKPDTLNDIEFVQDAFSAGKVKILRGCEETLKSIGLYSWDSRAMVKGLRKPDKSSYDHPCDSLRAAVCTVLSNGPGVDYSDNILTGDPLVFTSPIASRYNYVPNDRW